MSTRMTIEIEDGHSPLFFKKIPVSIERGKGLLIGLQLCSEETATCIANQCLKKGLFVRQTQGDVIRIFPALNINPEHMEEGLAIIEQSIADSAGVDS